MKVGLTLFKPDMPHFQHGACTILEIEWVTVGCEQPDSTGVPTDRVIFSAQKSSDKVLRPSGPGKTGLQLRGISGMTFSKSPGGGGGRL